MFQRIRGFTEKIFTFGYFESLELFLVTKIRCNDLRENCLNLLSAER